MTGETLAGNITRTVATAEAVLDHFERSLQQAGFADNAEAYRKLADTLLGQRLWVASSGEPSGARFRAVGQHARAIQSMLEPYVEAFRRLSALASDDLADPDAGDRDGAGAGPDSVDDPARAGGGPVREAADEHVLAALAHVGRPMSLTALRAALDVPRPALLAAVERLAEAGEVTRRHTGGRELIERARP
jgi:hypothetical protein